ncbi:MAG: hypothetical protein IPK26_27040 [Planctomycetes bacterium]|nr:hypothetical protein [Planctomycetota bacterium]
MPCERSLVGFVLGFQGIDCGASFGCSGAVFGTPLRTTDTPVVTFR